VTSLQTDAEPAKSGVADLPGNDLFARLGIALDDAAVTWCRLRERGDDDEDDLLIWPGDMDQAGRVISSVGFREIRHLGHGSHRAFFGYDPRTDRWPKVDVVTTIDYGRLQEWRTGLATGCLARRERDSDGWRLADDDAFWTLLLHDTLDRPHDPFRRVDRLRELAGGAQADGTGAQIATEIAGPRWTAARIVDVTSGDDPADRTALAGALGRGLERGRAGEVLRRRMAGRILRRLDHLDPPFLRSGLTVALLGPDGAGKSSLSMRIGEGGPMERRSVYLGLYGGARGRPRAGRHVPGLGLARRIAAMWRGWVIGWWHKRRGRMVIFDRHPLDARLPDGRSRLGSFRRAILGHILPKPDVVLVLDAPAALLYERKPEHTLERIEAQRTAYRTLARRVRGAIEIDVSRPLEDVARTVTAAVWDRVDRGRMAR